MVRYMPPILMNFEIVSYSNPIFENHYTEEIYLINLDISHYCFNNLSAMTSQKWVNSRKCAYK